LAIPLFLTYNTDLGVVWDSNKER